MNLNVSRKLYMMFTPIGFSDHSAASPNRVGCTSDLEPGQQVIYVRSPGH
ncbi:hypothetical protein TRAPUB_832 [Trametes pubescens]|uniref:Uncharacterized protein n=1 Tax=Trametes pubescens TaxID=154538 RepID=A0A1M2VL79_TRAPU|nr:hypothetical protein TRAPUB_832 [Trametes pubescens]